MLPSNNYTLKQQRDVAKKYRDRVNKYMKHHGFSFLKELCGVTNQRPDLTKAEKAIGYFRYEAGIPIDNIAKDLALSDRHAREYCERLLDKLGIRTDPPVVTT